MTQRNPSSTQADDSESASRRTAKNIWSVFHGNFNQVPFPNIGASAQEIQYTVRQQKPDGVMAYRLAPFHQAIGDCAFMRLLWNPELTVDQLADEAAGLLVSQGKNRAKMKEAVLTPEPFWQDFKPETVAKSKQLLDEVKAAEPSPGWWFDYTYDGVWMLALVAEYARFLRSEPTEKERNKRREEIVEQA